uniref:Carbohydrate sulfotransferase n=1 Tax=Mola mola TaxID=94237 RepID=A0A3Q3X931_MOLML
MNHTIFFSQNFLLAFALTNKVCGFISRTVPICFYLRVYTGKIKIQQLQEWRKVLIREVCDSNKKVFYEGKQSWEDIPKHELDHLIVDDNHGIIYCFVPKVACTNLKRIMFVLRMGKPYQDPMSIPGNMVHPTSKLTYLSDLPKLKHYTKFLFVRNPFVRLISAFRDKFQSRNELYYNRIGRDILRLYGKHQNPPLTVDEAFASGILPSFHNFIQYLLDPETRKNSPFDYHWRQMYHLCHPCRIQYDFIGHQENLQEEAEQLLRILRLEDDIKFPPSYENITTVDFVLDWFQTLTLEERRNLYKLYKLDFKLFGYPEPHELLDG